MPHDNPQHETIADLALNAPVPPLESALERAGKGVAALEAPATPRPEPRSLVTGPFVLGVKIPLTDDRFESLAFTFHNDRKDDQALLRSWDYPALRAVLSGAPAGPEVDAEDAILLVLYDDQGRPVGSARGALQAGRAPVVLDLGELRSLGSAKHWSLTLLTKDGPHAIAPAVPAPRTVVSAFPVRPGEARVVQVEAVPDFRSPLEPGTPRDDRSTRLRTLRLGDDDLGSLNAEMELVSTDLGKGLRAKVTLVLLDEKDVPAAVGSLESSFRVEWDVYDSTDLAIPLQGKPVRANAARVVAGMQTVTTGLPMGTHWMTMGDSTLPYPIGNLLAGDDPAVWSRGLAVLADAVGRPLTRGRAANPDGSKINESTWGTIHQLVRPHGDRLVALFPKAEDAGPRELARLCLLAGYSGDERLAAPLKPRLDHPDDAVRDAAAIGLGFLGQGDGRARLESIVARPEPSDAAAKAEANRRKTDAKRALHVLGN